MQSELAAVSVHGCIQKTEFCKRSIDLATTALIISFFMMSMPILVALAAFALLFLRFLFTFVQNHRFAKAHGCQEVPQQPQFERIIGYDSFKRQVAMFKAKQVLPDLFRRFEDVGNTFSHVSMGRKIWVTREPENVKAVLATNFKDFGIGQRFRAMGPLLGQGIFTSDGALWEHSRVRAAATRGMRGYSLHIGPRTSQLYQKPGSGP